MKNERVKPEQWLITGIFAIIGSVALFFLATFDSQLQRGFYSLYTMAGCAMCIGIYLVKKFPAYKERYHTIRKFSQPIAPDGSEPEDNSEELQKLIDEEISKDPPKEAAIKALLAALIFTAIVIASFLDGSPLIYMSASVLIFFFKFLRQVSRKAWIYANRISIIFSILSLCCLVLIIYNKEGNNEENFDYFFISFVLIFTPLMLLIDTIVEIRRERKKEQKKAVNEA